MQPTIDATIERIRNNRLRRENYINTIGEGSKPYLYIIVATGNIYEDIIQAKAGAKQGADIIAVIRTTGQSLLALEALVEKAGGIICGKMAILAEGDAQERPDLIYLEKLPLFNPDGTVMG